MDIDQGRGSGKFVFLWFLAFFGTIIAVNSTFIYTALHTNTGVVTDNAYEKGLAYNRILDAIRDQPQLEDKMTYQNGTAQWTLRDASGHPVTGARAVIFYVRPVKDGYDFSLPLTETYPGVYEARTEFPVHGLWTARLDLKWNKQHYQTAQDFIVP